MVTTIQLSEEVKRELSKLKNKESYEEVIKRLLKERERYLIAEDMAEYGKKHGKDSLKELKEWEGTDLDW